MTDTPLLHTADALLGPGLERFYVARPQSFQHINLASGVYWHPFLAMRAQAALALKNLATNAASHFLATATGTDLADHVNSEFGPLPIGGDLTAIGEITVARGSPPGTNAGDIPKGSKLSRPANTVSQIPYAQAEYETLIDAHFDLNQVVPVVIPIRATSPGPDANFALRTDAISPSCAFTGSLFDPTLAITTFSIAGGSKGLTDPDIVTFARTRAIGQYGPTTAAGVLSALNSSGVKHVLTYDEIVSAPAVPGDINIINGMVSYPSGTQVILVADASWGGSSRWVAIVQQAAYDSGLVGNGCKIKIKTVRNLVISVRPTVVLRDQNYLTDTTQIDLAIGKAVRAYFDDRPDWNVWKLTGLKAAITRAHSKIMNCTAVTVSDVLNNTLTEITTPDYTVEQYHYYLANNAVKATYVGPN